MLAAFRFYSPVLLLAVFCSGAQAVPPATGPAFSWVSRAGGMKDEKTRGVAVDAAGNVYLTGQASSDISFAGEVAQNHGAVDFFVAKLDAGGNFLWGRLGGGSLTDRGYAIVADAEGSCYVTGQYESRDAMFEGQMLPNRGNYDLFLAKYDRDGKVVWMETGGGSGYDYGHGIALDAEGDLVIAGAVVDDAEFGGRTIAAGPGRHLYCAKYHRDGRLVWAKVSTGGSAGSAHGIAVDGKGNIYLGGLCAGVGDFGGQMLGGKAGEYAVVTKLSPAGEVLWVWQGAGKPSCLFHEITCDREGRVWASGMFSGEARLGSETFRTTGGKDSDALLCHFDTDGKLRWTRVGQGPGIDYGLGVATDGQGNCFLTGEFRGSFGLGGATLKSGGGADIFVARLDAAGTLSWLVPAGGPLNDNAYSMVFDGKGGLVLGGAFSGAAAFGERKVESVGASDLYVAKLPVP